MAHEVPIASIRAPAIERDGGIGNIDALAASIRRLGLLQPVVVSSDRTLLVGRRRLAACRALGWKFIPTCVMSVDALEALAHENYDREPLALERLDGIKAELIARDQPRVPAPIAKSAAPAKRRAKAQGLPSKGGVT